MKEVCQKSFLLIVQLRLVKHSYVMLLQTVEHMVYSRGVLLAVGRVELVYLRHGLAYRVVLSAHFLIVRLKQTAERSHAYAEKLVEIVRINTQK